MQGDEQLDEPETVYDAIKAAADGNSAESVTAKTNLIAAYRPFVIKVVSTYLLASAEIEDVAHDFILNEMINGKVIANYDGKRRFRPFLRTCVRNYCIDYLRKRKRAPDKQPLIDDGDATNVTDEADAIWARTIFANALAKMKSECEHKGQIESIWNIFQHDVLHPLFHGTARLGHEHYGLTNKTHGHRLETGYRKLRRFLNEEIAELNSVESQQSLFHIIGELLKVPLANEPMVQQLLSKTFRDDDISEVFVSDGVAGGLAGLFPPIDTEPNSLRSRWLQLLQSPVVNFLEATDDLENNTTVDDAIFLDSVTPELLAEMQDKAKLLTDSNDCPHVYFALYTLLICKALVVRGERSSSLLTNQLLHNISTAHGFDWIGDDSMELLQSAVAAIDQD